MRLLNGREMCGIEQFVLCALNGVRDGLSGDNGPTVAADVVAQHRMVIAKIAGQLIPDRKIAAWLMNERQPGATAFVAEDITRVDAVEVQLRADSISKRCGEREPSHEKGGLRKNW